MDPATAPISDLAWILMFIGIAGLLVELMNPGTAVGGVVGGACLLLALYVLQVLPASFAVLGLLLLIGLIGVAVKVRKRALVSGDAGLVGSLGRVTAINDDPFQGWVQAQGEQWQARSQTPLHVGQSVRVVARQGVQLRVSAAAEQDNSGE